MPTGRQTVRHVFAGGWASDYGLSAEIAISPNGVVQIPFFTDIMNYNYELDGSLRKIGGTARMNSTVVESGEQIKGLFDYWKQGIAGSPSQKLVIRAGTRVLQADLDGNFATLGGVFNNDVVVSFETFDDLLIIATDKDSPQEWDQSTFQALQGSPPDFAFCETHKNRVWAAGVDANPSLLYYSAHLDPNDWTGEGSGSIAIDPDDGDRITGIASHKDELWVFKGPYKGSIHRIVGSAPTGSDAFARRNFVRGLGAVGHNTIFRYMDDLGFMWQDGSVHSLNATAAYGDFNEASLSRPINSWIRENINGTRIEHAWAINDSVRGFVIISVATGSSTDNDTHLVMDYRFNPPRWTRWDAYESAALAMVVDTSGFRVPFDGSNDGYVRRINGSGKNVDTTGAIDATFTTPYISYGDPGMLKIIERGHVGLAPYGDDTYTFSWIRDAFGEQTYTASQGGGGGALDSFVLDTDTLGGQSYADRFFSCEEGGEFRQIRYKISNDILDEDIEVRTFSTVLGGGGYSGEN